MNGTMKYTRRVNLGHYEHKEFTAEISYSVQDEDDYLNQKAIIDRTADLAVQITEERLGLRPTTAENVASVKAALKAGTALMNAPITKAEVEKASKPALHLVETAQPEAVELPDDDGVVVTVVEPEPAPVDVDLIGTPSPAQMADIQEAAFDVAAPIEPEITYDDLYNMANGWVTGTDAPGARSRRTTAFQKLMRKYATQLSAIPQDRRPAFVAEFTELQAGVV